MFSIYTKLLVTSNAYVWYWLQLLCASLAVYDRCLAGKPAEKPAGLSHDAAPSSAGRFLKDALGLPLADLAFWMATNSTLGQQCQRKNPNLSCAYSIPINSLSYHSSNSHLLSLQTQFCYPIRSAVCNVLAQVWQMNDSTEWLGLQGPSEMLGTCIPCARSLPVGLTKAIAYYILHGHVSEVMSSKNSFGPSLKIAQIIAWLMKVQKFKSWELLLARWIKIP